MTDDGWYLAIDSSVFDDWRIGWYNPSSNEFGLFLGEGKFRHRKKPRNRDDWECWVAERAVSGLEDGCVGYDIFSWESRESAEVALRAANDALLREDDSKPWPRWAMKAKEAGWTPPDNWKP